MNELNQEDAPVHTCPVQGPGTKMQRALDMETQEMKWVCVWCMMAEQLTGVDSSGKD